MAYSRELMSYMGLPFLVEKFWQVSSIINLDCHDYATLQTAELWEVPVYTSGEPELDVAVSV